MSYERMCRSETELEAEIAALQANVAALLAEAEAVDAAEDERYGPDGRGDELPEELQRREQRLARIREAKEALEAEAAARETARRAELAEQGKTPRQPPNGRDPFKPKPRQQRNFTDPESRIMKTADGAFHQCFSGQALVDARAQVIVAAELSDEAPDTRQLEPALEQLADNLDQVDAELPDGATLSADAGYFSAHNITITSEYGLDPHIATGRRGSCEPRRAARSTPAARRSWSRCSASSTPSRTPASFCSAGNRPHATNGASTARSTTSSSCTEQAASASSRRPEPDRRRTGPAADEPTALAARPPEGVTDPRS
jgi:hypothetical protein